MKRSVTRSGNSGTRGRRRPLLAWGTAGIIGAAAMLWAAGLVGGTPANATEVQVFKSAYCGCCDQWSRHMRDNGFNVHVKILDDMGPLKIASGVTPELTSCHTALIDGYVVEGHVPADVVKHLLSERPEAIGIAVPGMPSSAPGMDRPTGESYNVVIFAKDGATGIYARR